MDQRLLLRPEEAAIWLGISRSRCYELIAQGVLPCCRIGRSVRVPTAALTKWVIDRTDDSLIEETDEQGDLRLVRRP